MVDIYIKTNGDRKKKKKKRTVAPKAHIDESCEAPNLFHTSGGRCSVPKGRSNFIASSSGYTSQPFELMN